MYSSSLYIIVGGVVFAAVFFGVALYFILRSDYNARQRSRIINRQRRQAVNENGEPIDQGVLSQEAGFQGLLLTEREKIMGEWLSKASFQYDDPSTATTSTHTDDDFDIEAANADTAVTVDQDDENLSIQEEQPMCSICYEPYRHGDSVMTGAQCDHLFHTECAQQWLVKTKHDHCPYCREEIMQPSQFLDQALSVLGEKRVAELCQDGGNDKKVEEDSDVESNDAGTDEEADTSSDTSLDS